MSDLKIVKNGEESAHNDNGQTEQEFIDSDKVFIVQIINYKNEVGYMAEFEGKKMILKQIGPLVKKFTDHDQAKAYGNTLHGVQKKVIGKHKIAELIAAQDGSVTIPVDKVETDMYHVVVLEKTTKSEVGYITYKPETDEYSVIKGQNGAAFWGGEKEADTFIDLANKTFFKDHKDLVLEKVKYK
jgi:hypothetical protein